jgi:recombination protein RecA
MDNLNMLDNVDLSTQKEFDKVLSKKFGNQYKGFRDQSKFESVKRIPMLSESLNRVLGGGLPVGRMIEIFGDTGSCKTSVSSHIISSYQAINKLCMFVDVEHSIDADYMGYCGVDMNKLCVVKPNSAEEALEAVRVGMRMEDSEGKSVLNLIIIDSLAALVPSADLEEKKEIGTTMIGSLARLLSTSLKQLITIAAEKDITLVCLNQERSQNMTGYGPKTTTTGGKAVQYYSSIRLDLNRVEWIEENKEKLGQVVSIQAVKNKTHTPFKKAEVPFIFPVERNGKIVAGLDVFGDIINIALDNNIIERTGAWFTVPNLDKKLSGLKNVTDYYLNNEEAFNNLKDIVLNMNNKESENDAE